MGTLVDFDENVYDTIVIGTQEWTVENLRTTKYNDGTSIPHVTNGAAWVVCPHPATVSTTTALMCYIRRNGVRCTTGMR